jgi:hypothetical protein
MPMNLEIKKSNRLGFGLLRSQQGYFSEEVNNQAGIPDKLEKVDFDVVRPLTYQDDFIVILASILVGQIFRYNEISNLNNKGF